MVVGARVASALLLILAVTTTAAAQGGHFATHAELSESDPLSSAVLLVPGAGEDGRLEVREVFGLDLHARLVVLSACETGLGKLSRGDDWWGCSGPSSTRELQPSSPRCGRWTIGRATSWCGPSTIG